MRASVSWRTPRIVLLFGGLILFLCLGQRHSFGLFLSPMTMDLGWGREVFSVAIAIQNLVWGLAQPFAGMIADKQGSGRVLAAGAVSYAAGMLLMPYSTTGLELALSAGLLIGIGLSGTAFGIVYSAVGRAFTPERRGFALGAVGALGGLGQFVMLPYNQFLISNLGWASALIVLSATCALMIPLASGMVESPSAVSSRATTQSLAEAMGEAFRHPGFWLVTAGFLTCGFQLAFIATHLPAYLADQGLNANVAVTALAVVALSNILGTYVCGLFAGKYRQKYVLSALYFLRGLALLGFVALPVTSWSTYAFAAIMGVLWLGTVPLTTALVGRIFGLQYVATLFGFVFLGHQIGSFLGVWLGGALFDRTGSYQLVWILCIGLSLLAALVHFPVDDREIERHRMAPA